MNVCRSRWQCGLNLHSMTQQISGRLISLLVATPYSTFRPCWLCPLTISTRWLHVGVRNWMYHTTGINNYVTGMSNALLSIFFFVQLRVHVKATFFALVRLARHTECSLSHLQDHHPSTCSHTATTAVADFTGHVVNKRLLYRLFLLSDPSRQTERSFCHDP
jgi:hypothetical protein